MWCLSSISSSLFLSTPSARRATGCTGDANRAATNFYPRPPRGGRPTKQVVRSAGIRFLSTPSARRATQVDQDNQPVIPISIHALREEGDVDDAETSELLFNFYPRPPRGGRQHEVPTLMIGVIFLSTPSARRATVGIQCRGLQTAISIHALREEGDGSWPIRRNTFHRFLSTPSARRATHGRCRRHSAKQDFYPRPPRGGRQVCSSPTTYSMTYFYPRPPRGGRRVACAVRAVIVDISIHALREEGDCPSARRRRPPCDFYPRPPRGGRPPPSSPPQCPRHFYPRPPRGGRRMMGEGNCQPV